MVVAFCSLFFTVRCLLLLLFVVDWCCYLSEVCCLSVVDVACCLLCVAGCWLFDWRCLFVCGDCCLLLLVAVNCLLLFVVVCCCL